MRSWLEGRNWVEKCAQETRMTASLRILSSKAESNIWESFIRSGLKLESVHQESPRSDIFRKRATKPLLKHRQKHLTWATEKKTWTFAQWSKVLFSDKSKFCCNVCWCWFIVFYQVQSQFSRLPGDFGALCAYICWQALWRCWFPFPAGP